MAKHFLNSMIALLLLNSVAAILFDPYPLYRKFFLPSPAFGPDSVAFAHNNPNIGYVSISDGRILKFFVNNGTFIDFAYTSPKRTKARCDGNRNASLAPTCGKVFGLSVDNVNQILYAVDVNLGLFSINISQGGLATFITNTAGGLKFKVLNGIDVDPVYGDVYFTDGSQTFDYRNITPTGTSLVLDATGRLIKHNPKTKAVTVLQSGLAFPSGPAVSSDGTFVLIPQIGVKNIVKYYIRGPYANKSEIILTLPGRQLKIKRASALGYFWVTTRIQDVQSSSTFTPYAWKFDIFGTVVVNKTVSQQYPNVSIAVVQETNPFTIYVGARLVDYITQYSAL